MLKIYIEALQNKTEQIQTIIKDLPPLLQARIKRKKQKRKQLHSAQGYALLQKCLKKDFNTTLDKLSFLDSGKPVIANTNLEFSISHSNNLLGVALTTSGMIGLDIEDYREFEKVSSSFAFFSSLEQSAISEAANPNRKMIELWSKKETLVKAVGGQMFDMAQQTDVRFLSTKWLNTDFFFHPIDLNFSGEAWIATSFSTNNIVIEVVKPEGV